MSARQQVRKGHKALPVALIGQAIRKLTRHELEAVTERLIERLDEIDGDVDLEPEEDCCSAGDDGCGPIIRHGVVHWGSDRDETRHLGKANYAEDQRIIILNAQYGRTMNVEDWPLRL